MEDNDHTDAEIARRQHDAEMGGDTPAEVKYYDYLLKVEDLLGVSLCCGDQKEDGYSLDEARALYEDGVSAHSAAMHFRQQMGR